MVTSSVSPIASQANVLRPAAVRSGGRSEERVLLGLRQSMLAPLVMMWPVAVGGALWVTLNGVSLALTGSLLPWPFQAGFFALILALAVRWLIRDGLNWYACCYTLTSARLIVEWGVLSKRRRQAPLGQIQNVRVLWPNPLANLLDIGDVRVRTAGASGDLRLTAVSQPEVVAQAIMTAQRVTVGERREPATAHGGGIGAVGDGVSAAARAVLQAMDTMGGLDGGASDSDEIDPLESDNGAGQADGVLRRALVALLPDERVVARLHRHWFVLLRKLSLPLIISALLITTGGLMRPLLAPSATSFSWGIIAVGAVTGLVWGGLMTLNYVDDVFILTTRRIIDIDRRFAILAEARREAFYNAVQDVAVSAPPLGRILGYGRISVETAGQSPNIEMDNIAYPLETQDRIFALIRREKQRNATQEGQTHRRDLREVVGQALNALLVPMPDARGLPVSEAITRMRREGLNVSVVRQRSSAPGAPGIVLGQSPRPGATLVRGGEAQLVVSRSNTPPPSPPPGSGQPADGAPGAPSA